MSTASWVQIMVKAICISYNTDIFVKGMNPIIFPPVMNKKVGRLGSLTLECITTSQVGGKIEICLKRPWVTPFSCGGVR